VAAALNWNAETVTSSDGRSYGKQMLIVSRGVATLKTDAVEKAGVQGIYAVSGFPTSKRRIVFEDGTEWLVSRKRGCNCR
jgi:hypothetical protein